MLQSKLFSCNEKRNETGGRGVMYYQTIFPLLRKINGKHFLEIVAHTPWMCCKGPRRYDC